MKTAPITFSREVHGKALTPEEAIERLKNEHAIAIGLQKLADLRSAGGSPPYFKPSPRVVRYPELLLDQWAEERNAKPILDRVSVETAAERRKVVKESIAA